MAQGTTFVGVDLAWANRNRTGLAAVDASGTLVDLAEVRTGAQILDWLATHTHGPCLVAIDAPIVVNNPTGSRPCERALGQVFGRYDAGAHPSNTSRPEFAAGARALRLAQALDLDIDPGSASSRRGIEVYPHPATVALFGLTKTIKYKHKPGRDLGLLRSESLRLMDLLESLEAAEPPLVVRPDARWQAIRGSVEDSTRKVDLKTVEDVIDAVLCAYIGLYSERVPGLTHTFGDVATGYIVTPVTAAMLAEIARRDRPSRRPASDPRLLG